MAFGQGGNAAKPTRRLAVLLTAEWIAVSLAVLTGVLSGAAQPWGELGALLLGFSWLVRGLRTGAQFFPPHAPHAPLVIFLASAVIGAWAAPDLQTAIQRLYLILTAASLYLLLLESTSRIQRIFSLGFAFLVGLGSLFLFTQIDWTAAGGRVGWVGQELAGLLRTFPQLPLEYPPWDVLRNLIASLSGLGLIFVFAAAWEAWQLRRIPGQSRQAFWQLLLALVGGVLLGIALAVTTSRTPWIIFAVLAGIGLLWQFFGMRSPRLFSIVLVAVLFLVGIVLSGQMAGVNRWLGLSGSYGVGAREEIYAQSMQLAREKPFTGAGLGAFPALYSEYIQVIPYRSFLDESTGSNAYLNILVEQGVVGLTGYVGLLTMALWLGFQRLGAHPSPYRTAGLMAVIFLALHGFSHSTLAATRALPLLLAPLGMALAWAEAGKREPASGVTPARLDLAIYQLLFVGLVGAFLFFPGVRAQGMANLGAVAMDRQQLAGFPRNAWRYAPQVSLPAPARTWFAQALALNPSNATANFRLGVAAMQQEDFSAASLHLEKARAGMPLHRGVQKILGYSLLWEGEIEQALPHLAELPEIPQELEIYIHWWRQHGRRDLSDLAREARTRLLVSED
jgi:tetratricopeptide (TPR) repeat protein